MFFSRYHCIRSHRIFTKRSMSNFHYYLVSLFVVICLILEKINTAMSCFQLRCIDMVIHALWMYSSGFNRSSNHDHFPSWSWTAVIVMPYCNTVHQCVMNVSLRIETHLHVHQRPNSGLMSRSDRERLLYNTGQRRSCTDPEFST